MNNQPAHSDVGPSSLARRIACPGSRNAERGQPDEGSTYARKGTGLHELAANCLTYGYDMRRYIGTEMEVEGEVFTVDEADAELVQTYLTLCRGLINEGTPAQVKFLVEHRFDLTEVYAGLFGTADFVCVNKKLRRLDIVDLKTGRGVVVDAVDNVQLQAYALGALYDPVCRHNGKLVVDTVRVHISQGENKVSDDMHVLDLVEFANEVAAALALTDDPNAERFAGGHCKFCKGAGACPALRDQSLAIARTAFGGSNAWIEPPVAPTDLDPRGLADVMAAAHLIEIWLKSVKAHAHAQAEAGVEIPGWKLVQKRASRSWSRGEDEVIKRALDLGYPAAKIAPPKCLTPAQVEKVVGKAGMADFGDLVQKISSGTNLAATDDTREALEAAADRAARTFRDNPVATI